MSAAPRVYISSADKPQFVKWLSHRLSAQGIEVFSLDQIAKAGMNRAAFADQLERELDSATVFLPILTPAYVQSQPALNEMMRGLGRQPNLNVIPLLAEACRVPAELDPWIPFDFRPVDEAQLGTRVMVRLVDKLAATIKSRRATDEERLTEIEFPVDLITNLRVGQCVLYAGAGLSAVAGLPVWKEFASGLVEAVRKGGLITEEDRTFFCTALESGKTDHVVDQIVGQVEPAFILAHIQSLADSVDSLPASHQTLAELPFSAVLTTNFDDLLERAFSAKVSVPLTPADTEQLFEATTQREFFLLKLYGTLNRPESLLVSPAQFQEFVADNQPFRSFIESLFVSRTILFTGCSLEGIETYLRGLRVKDLTGVRHYALSGVLGTSWETSAKVLERRFGIHVIPYRHGSDVDLIEALSQLRRQVWCRTDPSADPRCLISPKTHPAR